VPTHQEEPWEQDRRAAEDLARRAARGRGGGGPLPSGRGARPRGRVELSAGGRRKARRVRVRWPRLVISASERRFARLTVRFLVVGCVVFYTLSHHSVFFVW
jgi:hypothetical protein